jgi:hypothetical protein
MCIRRGRNQCSLSIKWRCREKVAICKSGRGFFPEPNYVGTSFSNLQPLELWENKYPLFKSPSHCPLLWQPSWLIHVQYGQNLQPTLTSSSSLLSHIGRKILPKFYFTQVTNAWSCLCILLQTTNPLPPIKDNSDLNSFSSEFLMQLKFARAYWEFWSLGFQVRNSTSIML